MPRSVGSMREWRIRIGVPRLPIGPHAATVLRILHPALEAHRDARDGRRHRGARAKCVPLGASTTPMRIRRTRVAGRTTDRRLDLAGSVLCSNVMTAMRRIRSGGIVGCVLGPCAVLAVSPGRPALQHEERRDSLRRQPEPRLRAQGHGRQGREPCRFQGPARPHQLLGDLVPALQGRDSLVHRVRGQVPRQEPRGDRYFRR